MFVLPTNDKLSDALCINWLEGYLHPEGLVCPHCGSAKRRVFRKHQAFPAYRCYDCDGYYTMLSTTAFKKTRQRPTTLVRLLQGTAQGKTAACLARELGLSYSQTLTLQHRLSQHLQQAAAQRSGAPQR